jgi:RNA polymerase sigma-70 factor (ECF subfamily)
MNPEPARNTNPSDAVLISCLIQGDMEAFRKIYGLYFRRVFHFTRRFALTIEDAEEITQDVFLKLWHKRSLIDGQKNFSNYLFTIAQHLVIDKMRQYVAYEKRLQTIKIAHPSSHTELNSTEQLVNYYELTEILTKLIENLPVRRRTVFKLNREKGFSYHEIAELLQISQGTVEKQMSKALKTLTSELKSKYGIMIGLALLLPAIFIL